MRQHLDKHNTKFNNLHTELLLNKYQRTNKELESTKQSLQKTNLELYETKEALKESNEKIKTLDDKLTKCIVEKKEFEERVNKMRDIETLQIQKCIKSIADQLKQTENMILNGNFETLLPLLSEENYQQSCSRAEEKVVKVEYKG